MSRSRDIVGLLHPGAARTVRERMRKHTAANVEADIVAEMNLVHLLRIVGADEALRARFGFESDALWNETWEAINDLRNRVAHPTKPLLASSGELVWLITANTTARRITSALRGGTDALPAQLDPHPG